nr:unnamed protein product [Callosobruchus chinensis]
MQAIGTRPFASLDNPQNKAIFKKGMLILSEVKLCYAQRRHGQNPDEDLPSRKLYNDEELRDLNRMASELPYPLAIYLECIGVCADESQSIVPVLAELQSDALQAASGALTLAPRQLLPLLNLLRDGVPANQECTRCKFERENNACPLYKEKFGLRGLVKYEFYFKYFNENYSLRFGRCQVDVCSECERLNAKIKDKNLTVKRVAIAELIVQKRRAKKFYTKLKEIEAICHERPEVMGIAFDYIQNLPLPNISVQEIFYFRELWVYGFKIHNLENNTGHFYTYHEDQALKGPNEVCSFLYDYILNHIPEEITEFPLFLTVVPDKP